MTRDEFEALLEEAFMAGYEDAEEDIVQESNAATKARNREIGNKVIEGRFRPVRFTDKKDDEDNQKKHLAMATKSIFDKNPSLIRRNDSGRIKDVSSQSYGTNKFTRDYNLKMTPYLDRTNVIMNTNKMLKDIKDPEERKNKIAKAKEIFKRLQEKRKNN